MCGIGGVARLGGGPLSPDSDGLLDALVKAMRHRGPDDERMLREDNVGLAFTRLSLVDPESGGQPLTNADGSIVLIANGEVYNHRELAATLPAGTKMRTGSDCEVLVHLYERDGLDFLDKVHGMFAIVLWDRRRDELVFCRDRFGIKPLFFHRNSDRIVFASEIKALFSDEATPRRLAWDRAIAEQTLNLGTFLSTAPLNTWFEEIELVPAATIMRISLRDGSTRSHRYWQMPDVNAASDAAPHEYVARYRELLEESVRDCVMADAEVGLFLSGGIDSASVAALADTPGLRTFSALIGSTVANGDAEGAFRTARALGLANDQVLFPAGRAPSPDEWKRLLWLSETPLCNPEVFYKYELHRYVRANYPDIKGMLLGAAADEFNGGYALEYTGGGGWDQFVGSLAGMAEQRHIMERPELLPWWASGSQSLLNENVLAGGAEHVERDAYQAYLTWNYRGIQQYNVWHEDRSAAGNGIEARVPFLDHRLVELVASIPPVLRPELLFDKQILRRAMAGVLPEEVLGRRKLAFFHGDGERHTYRAFLGMLTAAGDSLVEEALAGPRAKAYLNADGLRQALRSLESEPSASKFELVLRLVNLGLLDAMTDSLPPVPSVGPFAPVATKATVTDWDADADSLRRQTYAEEPISGDGRYALHPSVRIVSSPAEPETWYVAIDGSFEYTLDAGDDAVLLNALLALDGRRSLDEAVRAAGGELPDVLPQLREAFDTGVIVSADT